MSTPLRAPWLPWAIALAPIPFSVAAIIAGPSIMNGVSPLPAVAGFAAAVLCLLAMARAEPKLEYWSIGLNAFAAVWPSSFVSGALSIAAVAAGCFAVVVVTRRRRRRNAARWRALGQAAAAYGHRIFIVEFAKPNGAKTDVNGFYLDELGRIGATPRSGGASPAGSAVALDNSRRVYSWVPASFGNDAERIAQSTWPWW